MKFLEVTQKDGRNTTTIINVNHISMMEDCDTYTRIMFMDGTYVNIDERCCDLIDIIIELESELRQDNKHEQRKEKARNIRNGEPYTTR